LSDISAREWGRRQAEAAPQWTDQQWRRACALLRVSVAVDQIGGHEHRDQGDTDVPERRAA
jgi:hypothetical protein